MTCFSGMEGNIFLLSSLKPVLFITRGGTLVTRVKYNDNLANNKSIKLYRCFSITYMLFHYSECLQTDDNSYLDWGLYIRIVGKGVRSVE